MLQIYGNVRGISSDTAGRKRKSRLIRKLLAGLNRKKTISAAVGGKRIKFKTFFSDTQFLKISINLPAATSGV